jgi:hypothetical protein
VIVALTRLLDFCGVEEEPSPMSYFGGLTNLALVAGVIALAALGGAGSGGYPCLDRDGLSAAREIFEGIVYGCERLKPGREGQRLPLLDAHRSNCPGH